MFYLVSHTPDGARLVDFADHSAELIPQIDIIKNDNADSTPAVLNDQVMKSAFAVDALGIPVQDAVGYLVSLS